MAAKQNNKPRMSTFFVPGTGIDREVITTDICRYLGNDALVKPGPYQVRESGLRRCLTIEMSTSKLIPL
jgi:hypothetical protein